MTVTDPTSDQTPELERLGSLWADVAALDQASEVLGWDQETMMPPKGQAGRGSTLAALAGLRHAKLASAELMDAIEACAAASAPGSVGAAQAALTKHEVVRATAVSGEMARREAELSSQALAEWQAARAADDFSMFAGTLAEVVAHTQETADALVAAGVADNRYDALLDGFEPGAVVAEIGPVLRDLADTLTPIVAACADSGVTVDEGPARIGLSESEQETFVRRVATAIGYDFDGGRLDLATHPFSTGFNPGDVRITWRYEEDDIRPGIFGVMHECGHALYEQGLPTALAGSRAGQAVSLGIHESQSRLWENQVGRSRAFWGWALPHLHADAPATAGVTVDALYPALHVVKPSLIRVESDEVTYNLHIVARFEIEQALMSGDLTVADVSDAWDDTYERLLGVRPSGPAEGVLQDIHWAMGAIGYFPTYSLGNIASAQLFAAARKAIGDVEGQFASGDFVPLLGWLRENVHAHGSLLSASDLVARATGEPLSAAAFGEYVRASVGETYGV